jgi:hypothetical protein
LKVVRAWTQLEAASVPVVESPAAVPREADCAAAGARSAEAFVDAVLERVRPVSAAVDYLADDYSAGLQEACSSLVDSVESGLAESKVDDSQADSVAAGSAVLSPADCSADSLLADLVAPAQADSAAPLADSVVRVRLGQDAHSLRADCPVDSAAGSLPEQVVPAELLADSPLALVVRDVPRLGEHRAYRRLRSPVCREAQPSPRVVLPRQPQVSAFALRFAPAVVQDAPPEPVVVAQKKPAGVEVFS